MRTSAQDSYAALQYNARPLGQPFTGKASDGRPSRSSTESRHEPAAIAAVGLYASLNVLILLWLATATSRLRGRHKVLLGDGGVPHLVRIMRGHANAAENMPMMMILLIAAVWLGSPAYPIHVFRIAFTLGRALHAWHFAAENGPAWQRLVGFGLSWLAMTIAALSLLGLSISVIF